MAEQADLDSRFARIEAALAATAEALEAAEGRADASAASKSTEAEADLLTATRRIETLEQEARDREATLGDAVARAEAAEAAGEAGTGDAGSGEQDVATSDRVAALEAKVVSLRAARAEDLSEMKALLAELEPLVEGANA